MRQNPLAISKLVEPDRAHRSCYTNQEIFERELDSIFHKAWIYVGHESLVKQPGDYATLQIAGNR